MSTLHTPGPWRRVGHRTIAAGTGPDRKTICELYSWGDCSEADGNAGQSGLLAIQLLRVYETLDDLTLAVYHSAINKSRNQVTAMPFGAFIRKKREEKGIQMNDFARQLEISPAYWSRIERDMEKPPKDELIRKAAEILGISADDAFVEASRLPPDIRDDVGNLVRMYRRNVTEKK